MGMSVFGLWSVAGFPIQIIVIRMEFMVELDGCETRFDWQDWMQKYVLDEKNEQNGK